MKHVNQDLYIYLVNQWQSFLKNPYLEEWLSAHLEYDTATTRGRLIIEAMKNFVTMNKEE